MEQNILGPWHDFFSLVGTAAATLVGLMFVAASVGTGVFTEERQMGLRTFLSPTVVAFSVVLATCLIGLIPAPHPAVPAAALSGVGLLGLLYSAWVWVRMLRDGIFTKVDLEDRLWYAFAPALAYVVVTLSGVAFTFGAEAAAPILAAGACLLLLAGIRNAWDMTTWVVLRRRS
jgi:hypothetical protein